jgi:hypothetical protein
VKKIKSTIGGFLGGIYKKLLSFTINSANTKTHQLVRIVIPTAIDYSLVFTGDRKDALDTATKEVKKLMSHMNRITRHIVSDSEKKFAEMLEEQQKAQEYGAVETEEGYDMSVQ